MPVQVTPILGAIEIGQNAELIKAKPAGNSTRWIFDVEGALDADLVIQLVEMRRRKPVTTDLVAVSFLPRSANFYDARPYMAEQVGGLITIRHAGAYQHPNMTLGEQEQPALPACAYRVMIDVLHTATR